MGELFCLFGSKNHIHLPNFFPQKVSKEYKFNFVNGAQDEGHIYPVSLYFSVMIFSGIGDIKILSLFPPLAEASSSRSICLRRLF
jgi:hypothetical protein